MAFLTVKTAVAGIHLEPGFESELITQALLWENLQVLDQQKNWFKIRQWDKYEGWIHNSYTIENPDFSLSSSITLTGRLTSAYSSPDTSQLVIMDIPMGVSLPVMGWKSVNTKLWKQVLFPDGTNGWLCSENLKDLPIREQIIQAAQKFHGVPYQWGGKSTLGCDCSGFLQTVFKVCGIDLPRDSVQQYELLDSNQVTQDEVHQGDIAYFRSSDGFTHIGIMMNSSDIIHCSGYVRISSLDKKSIEYDEPLGNNLISFLSIRKLLEEV